jgi:UDP-glucose 4-epimerase
MEKVMISYSRNNGSRTILCGTRYGNVMTSRGSVIPLFIEQILNGKPLTITEPTMTRFMMPLSDAVELVLYAFENAKPGDIFVQKAPAATVMQTAKALMTIFDKQVDTKIIGVRHGEKNHETLVTREEMVRSEEFVKYFRISSDNRELDYSKYLSEGNRKIDKCLEYTSENTHRLSQNELIDLLLEQDYVKFKLKNPSVGIETD